MTGQNPEYSDDLFQEMIRKETRKIRSLQHIMALAQQVLATQVETKGEAIAVIDGVRKYALKLFPDKEETFDLIYRPRLWRIYRERFETSFDGMAEDDS